MATFAAVPSCLDNNEADPNPEHMLTGGQELILSIPPVVVDKDKYEEECYKREYYFCPPLDEIWQMEIIKDVCKDPVEIISISDCFEVFECDPSQPNMGEVECITGDGFPGTQEKICDKGTIKYTDCLTLCQEEVCDYEDNDCDEFIDEGQLNACGLCGFVPPDLCDGVDNDCDGATDEDLTQQCSTACGAGVEYCIGGNWVSCTAPPVQIEVCDGFDNDCDGSIDEELKCECTINHVGALFPCNEAPLKCGSGYKTCECSDPDCVDIYTTDCVAPCVYFPEAGVVCDPTIGLPLEVEECNNFDDNCNGLIDEDLHANCYSGEAETLHVGICLPGKLVCEKGTWGNYFEDSGNFIPGMCKDEITPQEEVCNGIDDDCDGATDSGEEMAPVDILFIVDWSGSMNTEIFAVMGALNKFAGNYEDEEVLQWGVVIGPIDSQISPWKEHLKLHHNLSGFSGFMLSMAQLNLSSYMMTGAREMMYDALYLVMHNLVGVSSLPVAIADLTWDAVKGVVESDPPKESFVIDWRTSAETERVIILFTDEVPQSYFLPKITQNNLLELISKTTNTKIYVFTNEWYKEDGALVDGWNAVCVASGGKYYQLSDDMLVVYNSLMEIIDENACK